MSFLRRDRELAGCLLILAALGGCANPGPPRSPSLFLPEAAGKLTAARVGDAVELRFTVPQRATDGVLLREPTLTGQICRQVASAKCVPVGTKRTLAAKTATGAANEGIWIDDLPAELTRGPAQAVGYRVEFDSPGGKTGAWTDVVFAPGGAAPATVVGFKAEGSRPGVVLRWNADAQDEVVVQREPVGAVPDKKGKPVAPTMMTAEAGSEKVLDASAAVDVAYRYKAVRRRVVQVGSRTLEMTSAASPAVEFTLRDVYAPAAPTGLNAAGYGEPYAVDLVWQPVNDAKVTGYTVYRDGVKLGTVGVPGFHDAGALATGRYRYSVAAVDAKGNESEAVGLVVGQ